MRLQVLLLLILRSFNHWEYRVYFRKVKLWDSYRISPIFWVVRDALPLHLRQPFTRRAWSGISIQARFIRKGKKKIMLNSPQQNIKRRDTLWFCLLILSCALFEFIIKPWVVLKNCSLVEKSCAGLLSPMFSFMILCRVVVLPNVFFFGEETATVLKCFRLELLLSPWTEWVGTSADSQELIKCSQKWFT